MQKRTSKKVLTLVLALVLVFALSLGALAAWNQFQGGVTNNGVISTATPTTNPQTVLRVGLPTNDPYNPLWQSNYVWNSVDVTPLISGGKAYTLYNGGVTNGTLGGARLGITDLATGDTSSLQFPTNVSNASNGFLLSTPVIAGSDLYAAVTGIDSFATSPDFATGLWTADPSGWAEFHNDFIWFDDDDTGSVESNGYVIEFPYDFNTFTITTNISTSDHSSITYSIALKNSNNTTYPIVVNETALGTGASLYTYNGATIPAGSYKLIVTIGSHTSEGKVYSVIFNTNRWTLYKIANFATNPLVTPVQDSTNTGIEDWGQADTPITYDETYLYWGIYGGSRSYYQLNTTTSELKVFAANDDFYNAGATVLGSYVYFGGDSGTLYRRDISDFASSGTSTPVGEGKIRSSVSEKNGDLYFTTQGTAGTGTIQKFNAALVQQASHALETGFISSSTPVISSNGYVYIGAYQVYTSGRVYAFPTSLAPNTRIIVYTGDPVQASPIVYSDQDNVIDYVYFTTNSGVGAGYCYSFDGSVGAQLWTAGGASGNRYAIQGFATDNGYLVYGDDGGMLYIIH